MLPHQRRTQSPSLLLQLLKIKTTPKVGDAATEVIHEGKRDKKNPRVSETLLLKSSTKNLLLPPRKPVAHPSSNNLKETKRTTSTITASIIGSNNLKQTNRTASTITGAFSYPPTSWPEPV
jgi:hypothetical protein